MRVSHVVAIHLLALQMGCGSSAPCVVAGSEIRSISLEEGGMCRGQDPCWLRTTLTVPNTLTLENFNTRMTVTLSEPEQKQLSAIVGRSEFCSEVERQNSLGCGVAFDADAILTVETNDMTFVDVHAGRCIFSKESPGPQVYASLYVELDRVRRTRFPNGLNEPW